MDRNHGAPNAARERYRAELTRAIEAETDAALDWLAFHASLRAAVARPLEQIARRATERAGAAEWWNYTGRAALAAVPIGLAAALLLVTMLRSHAGVTGATPPRAATIAVMAGSPDSARAAFESVFTGDAAPQAVMTALIPAPAAAFLAESSATAR